MRRSKARIVFSMLAMLASYNCLALTNDDFAISISEASEQLTQKSIFRVFQDSEGFLWILSQEGIHRFDGARLRSFSASNIDGGVRHFATDIVESSSGDIWIATLGGGLKKLNKTTLSFTSIRSSRTVNSDSLLSDLVTSLYRSVDDKIYVGYEDQPGISILDAHSNSLTHHYLPNIHQISSVRAFAQTHNGDVYFVGLDDGLVRLSKDSNKLETVFNGRMNQALSDLSDITTLDDDLILVSKNGSAWLYSPSDDTMSRHTLSDLAPGTLSASYSAVFVDSLNRQWFGTSAGLAVFEENYEPVWYTAFDSTIPNNEITDIFEDESGIVWIGTLSGLAKATPTLFRKITEQDGLPSNTVNAVMGTENDEWWIGTGNGIARLAVTTDHSGKIKLQKVGDALLKEHTIMTLARSNNYVFAGTFRSGFYVIDLIQRTIDHYSNDEGPSSRSTTVSHNGITSILPITETLIAIGTYGGGLNILDLTSRKFTKFSHSAADPTTITDDRVICLLKARDDTVWIGTQNGLNKFNILDGTFERFLTAQTDPQYSGSYFILTLAEDHNEDLWIGTQGSGIHIWKNKSRLSSDRVFQPLDIEPSLRNNDIYGIAHDRARAAWITHTNGLTRIDRLESSTRSFDLTNGLQGDQFNHGAIGLSSNGLVLAGGPNGFNIIDPDHNYSDEHSPKLVITSVKIMDQERRFNVPYSELGEITLENSNQYLAIEFASLDYRQPSATRYRYRISDLQSEWLSLGNTRTVSLYGLKSGNYNLQIDGSNASGFWKSSPIQLKIGVPPPWWLSSYAFVSYSLLASIAAYLLFLKQRHQRNEELARRLELEEKVKERTIDLQLARVEAESAAKAKADFLASMSHELRTPIHGMIGVGEILIQTGLTKAQESLAQSAIRSGHALLEVITSILDYSRLEAGKVNIQITEFSLVNLIDEITILLLDEATKRNTDLTVFFSETTFGNISADEGKIRQIIINLVGNAIKFTKNGNVSIRVRRSQEDPNHNIPSTKANLCIDVVDDGIGIREDKQKAIFEIFTQADASTTRLYGGTGLGLSISKDLASLMHGSLSVDSKLGVGSRFTLEVPVTPGRTASAPPADNTIYCISIADHIHESLVSKLRLLGYSTETVDPEEICGIGDPCGSPIFVREQLLHCVREVIDLATTDNQIFILLESSNYESYSELPCDLIRPPYTHSQLSDALCGFQRTPVENRAESSVTQEDPNSHVLVVEDLELNQKILLAMLDRIGATSDVAANGAEAVDAVLKKRYDAIFMDCQMPHMDGFEATIAIRRLEKLHCSGRQPIIALTASADQHVIESAVAAGIDEVIEKPFSVNDIRRCLRRTSVIDRDSRSKQLSHKGSGGTFSAQTYQSLDPVDNSVVSAILDVSQSSSKLLDQLSDTFRDQLNDKISILKNCDMPMTSDDIRKTAHAIKSMSANIGAKRLREASSYFEENCSSVTVDDISRFTTFLTTEASIFHASLSKLFDDR